MSWCGSSFATYHFKRPSCCPLSFLPLFFVLAVSWSHWAVRLQVTNVSDLERLGFDPVKGAAAVSSAFGEMTFVHGFIHCDPHPGNLMVRPMPDGSPGPQVVILDHGMYRRRQPDFRVSYCRLWQALILRDQTLLRQAATELDILEYADILPLLFTRRSSHSKNKAGQSGMTKAEMNQLKQKYSILQVLHLDPPHELSHGLKFYRILPAACVAHLG